MTFFCTFYAVGFNDLLYVRFVNIGDYGEYLEISHPWIDSLAKRIMVCQRFWLLSCMFMGKVSGDSSRNSM